MLRKIKKSLLINILIVVFELCLIPTMTIISLVGLIPVLFAISNIVDIGFDKEEQNKKNIFLKVNEVDVLKKCNSKKDNAFIKKNNKVINFSEIKSTTKDLDKIDIDNFDYYRDVAEDSIGVLYGKYNINFILNYKLRKIVIDSIIESLLEFSNNAGLYCEIDEDIYELLSEAFKKAKINNQSEVTIENIVDAIRDNRKLKNKKSKTNIKVLNRNSNVYSFKDK